tara:strand:- start:567 stop:815 length:249 start_codon:yes stop_codon:yes gene_type:complete
VESIKGKRKLNKVMSVLSEWEIIGQGYNSNTEEYTYMFARDFENTSKWKTCAEAFPIHLVELTSHGNELVRNKKLIKQGSVL